MKNIKELISKAISMSRYMKFDDDNQRVFGHTKEQIIQALLPDMPEEKPEGYVAWHPVDEVFWMDGLPDNEYPQIFGSKREAEEYLCECSVLLVEGWQIRPVKLQFMDGK